MTARPRDHAVVGDPASGRIRIRLRLENTSGRDWDSAAGDFFSYQIRDARTETLLREGERIPFPEIVPPGATIELAIEAPAPAEDGDYRLFAAPLREGESWSFETGSPFLLVRFQVRDGAATPPAASITTTRRLAVRRLGRAVARAFVYPARSIIRHHSLIRSMVRRDIAGRYVGSHVGAFWTVVHPLLLMLTYWFVFGVVLRTRFGEDGRSSNFVLYFLAGMLPWLAFSEAAGRAANVVVEHANFVKKLVFPIEITPVNLVLAGLVTECFGLAIFLIGMVGFGREIPATALYVGLLLIPQTLFTMGLSWFLAATGVLFRDLGQVIGFALTAWFFMTPICYPETAMPAELGWLFEQNPLYVLVRAYRAVLLEGVAPEWGPFLRLGAVSAAVFVCGHAWFHRLKRQFADVL